jgi:beta-glucosidase/6-phospho-beta-glucosidase/beta-galactosidase
VGKKDLPVPQGKEARVPIIVSENGIATDDHIRRVEYYKRAGAGLKRAVDDGVDVQGYVAWPLLDNFEWMSGYTPKFGIVGVDLKTQKRTIKPSCRSVGQYRTEELPRITGAKRIAGQVFLFFLFFLVDQDRSAILA